MLLRTVLRRAAYRSGALQLPRQRLSDTLTVAMFHRVIDPSDPDFRDADPINTFSTVLFEELLEFFRNHYSIVSLADLFASADRARPLPDYSLLISFDDGWADNLRYAAPLLHARGMRAVVFVAAEPVLCGAAAWWQEQVFHAARHGALAAANGAGERRDPLDVLCGLATLAEPDRDAFLASLPSLAPARRMMLMPGDLPTLAEFGIAVGIHGYSHLPLTKIDDLDAELRRARSAIAALSGDEASATALACPHGRYDRRVLEAAGEAGIRLVFTSEPALNRLRDGTLSPASPLARIRMEAAQLTDASGRLDPSAAATWLWHRSVAGGRA